MMRLETPEEYEHTKELLANLEQRYLALINAARQERGLAPLKINATLVAEGREHANTMAQRGELLGTFLHLLPQGTQHRPNSWRFSVGNLQ